VGVQTPILVDLILSGDQDALAGFYDGRAPSVHEYCAQVCPSEYVEEAVFASFADFLGRARAAGAEADLDDLLRKSARTAAASRMDVSNKRDPACRSMPELIAARANGELPHDEGPINEHLERCRPCRQTAQRLVEAEDALVRPPSRQSSNEVRTAWLVIASREAGARDPDAGGKVSASEPEAPTAEPEAPTAEPEAPTAEPEAKDSEPQTWLPEPAAAVMPAEPAPAPEPPAAEAPPPAEREAAAAQPSPPPPSLEPVRVRRRSGGLIGAARRAATRKH
jgi:hypothetical protein